MKISYWTIKSKINKLFLRLFFEKRPSSEPYISGDSFRTLAHHIYETGREFDKSEIIYSFNPDAVSDGEIVFVQTDLLEDYFKNIHPNIHYRYVLITHNSDRNITQSELSFIDDKITHWYAQNVMVQHEKITPIPIGLENLHYYNFGVPKIFNKIIKNKSNERISRILFGFNIKTNATVRQSIFNMLSILPTTTQLKKWPDPKQYLATLKKYKFVASPPGNGEDCIRTWEAMLIGTIPILKRSAGITYFENLRLPLFVVNSFEELKNLTEYDLSVKYDLIMSTVNTRPLYMDYWKKLILSHKH